MHATTLLMGVNQVQTAHSEQTST